MATQVIGETAFTGEGDQPGSVSYELEPERLQRALGHSFVLGRLIGRGGYAEVFSARDLRLKRDVAIKVLRPDLIMTQSLLGRFRREAEAVAALHHPQIVPVFDVGEADGICYIVMPLLRGTSLKAVLHKEGRLPLPEVRRILTEAADALSAAHEAGVIHRDIKPENIMIEGPERRVLLMDFGIAKAVDAKDWEATATGVIVGTPQFMSPEQASGDPNIDHRTDQYSLAVVGYQMVSGKVPFEGVTARAVMTKQLLDPPLPLTTVVPSLPVPLARAIHKAMQKDRNRRFPDIKTFAEAINAATTTLGPEWERELSHPPSRRRWVRWMIGAAAAVAAVAAVAVALWRQSAASTTGRLAPQGPRSPSAPASTQPAPPPAPVAPPKTERINPGVVVFVPAPGTPLPPSAPSAKVETAKAEAPAPPDCVALVQAQDWTKAASKCLEEAGGGSVKAQTLIGTMVAEGHGPISVADTDTTRYLVFAANGGSPKAQFLLARRYAEGRGTAVEPTAATEMFLKAASSKYRDAYPFLARRYDAGLGVPRNESEAASWYEKAAKNGDVPSQAALAGMYAVGRGVAKDEGRAKDLFEVAANAGNADAEYELGMIYLKGKGVAKAEVNGVDWLRKAAAAGNSKAKKELTDRGR